MIKPTRLEIAVCIAFYITLTLCSTFGSKLNMHGLAAQMFLVCVAKTGLRLRKQGKSLHGCAGGERGERGHQFGPVKKSGAGQRYDQHSQSRHAFWLFLFVLVCIVLAARLVILSDLLGYSRDRAWPDPESRSSRPSRQVITDRVGLVKLSCYNHKTKWSGK